ncbi:cupin domain-containing protein [Paraburkholderia sp. J76]|uniref:cupin domain-containing protein n=1 Tax=Paraburkholderia sp. J76 TaxID=2805439 RepID=UPI002ABDEFA2|nr:cupin domain-containing protein [Paraburkholderia sp. J76]
MANDSGFSFVDSASMPWVPSRYAQGVEIKNLGKADGRAMQLVRFAAGATFPLHRHTGPEFIYVLEGEAVQNGRRLAAGYAGVAARGTVEVDFRSDTGCLFLLAYDLDQAFDKS